MKRFGSLFVIFLTTWTLAAHDPNRGHAEATVNGKKISISYGRPELKGRDMLAKLQPGMEWRMGMDAATSLSTETDLVLGDANIPAGTYSLIAKFNGPKDWNLIVSSDSNVRGTDRDASKDVAFIPLSVSQLNSSVEKFLITLEPNGTDSGELSIAWGTMGLSTDFRVKR
ncbi:MAG: DUF2911 domain-containing protein [Acidobacteriota bacterium]